MKSAFTYMIVAVLSGVFLLHATVAADDTPVPEPHPSKPNIVIVLVDTLRAAYLPIYGYPEDTMPFVNELSKDAKVFNRAFSTSSWTAPAVSSLFTSTYPSEHGIKIGMAARRQNVQKIRKFGSEKVLMTALPKRLPALPRVLQDNGYATFGVASNLNISPDRGFDRGFDYFESMNRIKAEFLVKKMAEWKSEIQGDKPYFLYFHFNDCHSPYQKNHPYYKRNRNPIVDARSAYTSEFPYVDRQIRAIHDAYVKGRNTIFVMLSDHGEEFREHGGLFHEGTLYDELNRVVMLYSGPEEYVRPGQIDDNVSLIDVMPTLLDIAGLPQSKDLRGRSLAPILRDDEGAVSLKQILRKRVLIAERSHPKNFEMELTAGIRGPWKLINKWGLRVELYNHDRDATEQNNVFTRHLRIADAMQAAMNSELKRIAGRNTGNEPAAEITLDDELLDQLEALGYVQ